MPQGRFLATDIDPPAGTAAPPMGRFTAADIDPAPVDLSLLDVPGQVRQPPKPQAPSPELAPRLGGKAADRVIDLITSGAEGVLGAGQGIVGLGDLATGGHAGKWARDMGLDLEGMRETNRTFYSPEQQAANRAVEDAEGLGGTLSAVAHNPSTIVHSVVQSVAPMLAGAGAARALGVVPWLARAAPFIGEGLVQAGSAAEQTERETGGLTPAQSGLAVASGVGTGLLGALGGKVAQKLGIADIDVLLAGGTSTPTARHFATNVVLSAVQEGLLEELPQSVQEQVLQNLAENRPLSQGVDSAAVLGAITGAAMGGGAQVLEHSSRPAAIPVTPRAAEPPAGETPAPAVEPPPVPPPVGVAPGEPPVNPAGAQPTGRFRPEDIEGVLRPQLPITLPVGDDETPARPETVRMYHGGNDQDGQGSRWFSSSREYAEDYARKSGGAVTYVDLPSDHPAIRPDYPEQSIRAGFHQNVELPADIAARRRPLPEDQTVEVLPREDYSPSAEARRAFDEHGAANRRNPALDVQVETYGGLTLRGEVQKATDAGVTTPFSEKAARLLFGVQRGEITEAEAVRQFEEWQPKAEAAIDQMAGRLTGPVIDTLDTGEQQPRLPGDVGAVRERNIATPQIEAPFSLTRETGEQPTGQQQGMFGAHEIDTPAAGAQTTDDVPARSGAGEGSGPEGYAPVRGVENSVPPHSRESAAQAERRRVAHYGDVFGHVLERARQVDPAVDEHDLRAEFDERVKFLDELDHEYRSSGQSPRALLEAIAKAGGISLDAEANGGLIGELRRLREGDATGPYGTFGGVPNVFRARKDGLGGKRLAGHSLDVILQSLHDGDSSAFNHIENTNDLLEALDDIARMGDVGARGAVYPGSKELARRAGVHTDQPWWQDSWREAAAAPSDDAVESDEGDDSFNVDELEAAPQAGREDEVSYYQQIAKIPTRQEDWGPRQRGQGKRAGGQVRGAMSAAPTGVKTYADFERAEGVTPEAWKEIRLLEDEDKRVAIGALQAGLSLDEAMRLAYPPTSPTKKTAETKKSSGTASSAILPVSTGLTRDLPAQPKGQAPIPVTPRHRPSDIVEQMRRLINDIPVSTGRFQQHAYGIYKIKERAIRLKVANNLQTFFHESGHHIDENVLGIERTDPRWESELLELGKATSTPSYSKTMKLREGAAEFLRWWFTEPAIARSKAPNYTAEFERRLDERPKWRDELLEVRENLQGLISQNPATRGRLRINREQPSRFPVLAAALADPREAIRAVASRAVDDLLPLRQAVDAMAANRPIDMRLNAYALARIARGAAGKAEAFLEHGVRGRDGTFVAPSLRDILKPVRESLDVLGDYLVAKRALELHGRGIEPGMPIAEAKGIIAETEERPDIDALEKAADRIYEFQDAVLEYARLYGGMSRQQIALIKHVNQSYVPMQRAFDAADGSVRGIAKRIAGRELPIKRIKGSGRDIIDPFESIITNTFAMVDMVEKNRAMIALVRQAEDTPDSARWLEKIPTPKVATRFRLDQVGGAIARALDNAGVGELDPKMLKKGFDAATKGVTDPSVIDIAGNAAKAGIKAVAPVPSNLSEFLDEMVTVWTPSTFARGNDQIVTVLRNGTREFWEVHDTPLYDAISVIGPRTTSTLMKVLGGPTKLLRAGATLTPGFILRNPGRDTLVAYMQSRYGFIPVYDTVKGLIAQVRGDEDAKLFYTSGVAQAAMAAQYRQQRQEAVARLKRGDGLKGVVFHPIDMLRAFSEWTETATRLGEFKLALDAGGVERGIWGRLQGAGKPRPQLREETIVRGTLAARDVTTDFARGGSITREINEGWAFFNARVQGYVRMTEAIQRDPVGVALKAASLALFSAALWALNADDEEYQEKENWEKQTYWHLRLGPDGVEVGGHRVKWLRIPKPFEWGYPGDIMEAALDYARKGDPIRFREMKESLVGTNPKQLIVSLMPTAVLPMLEAAINYSSFQDTHIVRPWDMDLESDLQYTEWTSETAKQLGKVIPVAPSILDHLIYGYTAGFGRGVVSGVDTGLGALGVVPRKSLPQRPAQQLPIVGAFTDAGGYSGGAQSIQDIYDLAERFASVEESVKTDVKRGDPASAQRRLERASEALPWEQRDAVKDARKALKELGPTIKAIYAAPPSEMTPAQKRVRLDAVREEMVDISRRALGRSPIRRKAQ